MSEVMDGFSRGDAAQIGPQIEAMLARGEQVTLQISGDSMRPTLKPRRDAVVLDPTVTWPPKRGDILLFRSERSPSGYALHRAVRITPDGPMMNGDAQEWTEGPIPREAVVAKAIVLIRGGKLLAVENARYRLCVRLWGITRSFRKSMFGCYRAVKRAFGRS